MQEAISGETPPDMLPRVLARACISQDRTPALASVAAPGESPGRRAPAFRRRMLTRVFGALALSVLLGVAAAWAMRSYSDTPQPLDTPASLAAQIKQAQARLDALEASERKLASDVWALGAKVESRRVREFNRLTREVVIEAAQRAEADRVAAEEKRRKQHLEHAQEVQRQDAEKLLVSMRKDVQMTTEQEEAARTIVADWGVAVLDAIKGHYRGRRHGDPRETRDKLSELAASAAGNLRALLDPRQQLVFDQWLARDGGALAQGSDQWAPPAVFSTWDDVEAYMEWRR